MKPSIVLLTDYGTQDSYAGILRGVIASHAPGTPVLDLTHGIAPQNVRQASMVLADSFRYFPKGSIFVCVVDPGVGTKREILCAKSKSSFFMAPDNGLLTGVEELEPFKVIRTLAHSPYLLRPVSSTFHGRDLFAPAASALAVRSSVFHTLGPQIKNFLRLEPALFRKTKTRITGQIIYFDCFGNAITNLKVKDAGKAFWSRALIKAGNKKIGPVAETYGQHKKLIALWNSAGRLEIALPHGKASSYLKLGAAVEVISEI